MRVGMLLRSIPFWIAVGALAAAPRIEVSPARVVEGDALTVRVVGLDAGQRVRLRAMRLAERFPSGNEPYRSHAFFRADGTGVIDLGRDAPETGSSYSGIDPSGLFWSMVADRLAGPGANAAADELEGHLQLKEDEVRFELEIDGVVGSSAVVTFAAAPGVVVREIREAGVSGVFAAATEGTPRPAIILLGGSEGGLFTARSLAPLLASQGFAVLGLGYFQGDDTELRNLPPTLEQVPLETLQQARDWLARQPAVDATRLAVVGVSKGAELALVGASVYPWIDAVAAFAPSHVVWEGIPADGVPGEPRRSSWTRDGRPLPFVRWSYPAEANNTAVPRAVGRSRLSEPHWESLVTYSADISAARIPIERSSAALLLLAGLDDAMWPSVYAVEQIAASARERSPARSVQVELLPTGHQILGTGWSPTTTFNRPRGRVQGGSPELDARAQALAWTKLRIFLRQQLERTE